MFFAYAAIITGSKEKLGNQDVVRNVLVAIGTLRKGSESKFNANVAAIDG